MSYYTNSEGEVIEVSQEHIDVALAIYEELANLVPSRRVSWKKHKELMEKEGFFDSEVSENYRCFIKAERRKVGILPSKEKFADLVTTSKINAIKQEIGEMKLTKQEIQDKSLSLSKLQREISRDVMLAEVVKETIERIDWSFNPIEFIERKDKENGKVALVTFADLHGGREIIVTDENGNKFFYDPTKDIVEDYTKTMIKYVLDNNITTLYIAQTGDLISGRLRSESIIESKLTSGEQTVEATKLFIDFVYQLSKYVNFIKVVSISGNHDRITANKNDALNNESHIITANAIMKMMFEHLDNVEYIEPNSLYHHVLKINGKNILLVHGDRDNVQNKSFLSTASTYYGTDIDVVVSGHYHRYSVMEVSEDKYVTISGALTFNDNYAKSINASSVRSQLALEFNDSNFEIRQIKF